MVDSKTLETARATEAIKTPDVTPSKQDFQSFRPISGGLRELELGASNHLSSFAFHFVFR